MEKIQANIKNYILKEICEIGKPKNPNQVYRFYNLNILVELLFALLDADIQEKSLQRVKDNFYNHVHKIIDFNESELPTAIEGLATNFEPFLKSIAYLKYGKTDLWEPDNEYSDGLTKTTLLNLLSGKISNKYTAPYDIL